MRDPVATKETILKKSGNLFNIQGYKATTISNITKATGFTKGAIYRHFTNKEALEVETLTFLSSELFTKLQLVIKNEKDAVNKLRAIFRFFESYITNPPLKGGCPLMNAAIEADDTNPVLKKGALKILNVLRGSIITILDNGIKYKQLKPGIDKEFYATLIIASLEGAIMMGKLSGNDGDIKRIIDHLDDQINEIAL